MDRATLIKIAQFKPIPFLDPVFHSACPLGWRASFKSHSWHADRAAAMRIDLFSSEFLFFPTSWNGSGRRFTREIGQMRFRCNSRSKLAISGSGRSVLKSKLDPGNGCSDDSLLPLGEVIELLIEKDFEIVLSNVRLSFFFFRL